MNENRLLEGLDPAQRRAVTTPTQPLAILAGAGSGKTRVLTRRIAYRCAQGDADPRHVMAVTFTRRAANQLDSRLRALGLRDLPATGTFHALAYAQLRTRWAGSGQAAPVLLDRKGRFLGRILGNTRRASPSDLATEIEWAKAQMVTPDRYTEAVHREQRRVPVEPDRIAEWYRRYEADKRSRGVIDFDDLLEHCARAIERDLTFAAAQHWRFRHLFVDEYQDVNPLQERLLRAWAGERTDLCVVGDPNQAIYRWNGADPRLLLNFERDHPGAEVVELRDSYRSTPQILAVASSILAAGRGTGRTPKSHRADGPVPVVVGYETEVDEANGIARAIRENHQPGRSWSSQAILVRTNAQTAVIEASLRRAAIPYRVRGGRPFLDDPDVRDLLGRIDRLREPLATTIEDLGQSIARERSELFAGAGVDEAGEGTAPELPDTAVGRRIMAREQVVALGRELLSTDPHATADSFTGWLRTMLRDDRPDGADAVTLASFHAAKGLEWDVVHVAGAEAGFLPISHARTTEARDEEQRLFYVAVTRAANVLRCTWAANRTFGADPIPRSPSPYLAWVREAIEVLRRAEATSPDPVGDLDRSRVALHGDHREEEDDHRVRSLVARELREWRAEQGRKAGVRPTVILSDKALDALARTRPENLEDLRDLPGIGLLARERHGAMLLTIIADGRRLAVDPDPAHTPK